MSGEEGSWAMAPFTGEGTQERGQELGRAVHVGALVHWAGFLFRCVISKHSPQRQMFILTLSNPRTVLLGRALLLCSTRRTVLGLRA